jgi:hypothetical protein
MVHHENTKLEHVFVIFRFDTPMAAEFGMDPEHVAVKKVVRSEEIANREVERLNRLNGSKGSVYFWRSARLDRDLRLEDEAEFVEATSDQAVNADHKA